MRVFRAIPLPLVVRVDRLALLLLLLIEGGVGTVLQAIQPVANWPAPPSWTPARVTGIRPMSVQSDIAGPLPFIPITPCRQYDSRNSTSLPNNTPRTIAVSGAPCGIPAAAAAVSANITVFAITAASGNGVFKVGITSPPTTAWINYPPSETQRANAGVLATDGSGNIVVQVNQGGGSVDLTVDVNGYYAITPATAFDPFKVINGGAYAIYGETTDTTLNSSGVLGVASSTTGATNGVYGSNNSSTDSATGVFGVATATDGVTVGVWGRSRSSAGAAGVYGEATAGTGSFFNCGVKGFTASDYDQAAGVYGEASQAPARGGFFYNSASGIVSYLSSADGIDYGLVTNSEIFGASLDITGAKNFVSPHPVDPSKEIKYASVEAPTVDVYFRGTGQLSNGFARIEVPDHFRLTAREGTYMTTLTVVGPPASLGVESEGSDGIAVRGSGSTKFHYVVYAERAEIEGFEPVQANVHFTPKALEQSHLLQKLPPSTKALLVKNGTLNPDGTYNGETARAMGWKIPEPRPAEASATRSTSAK